MQFFVSYIFNNYFKQFVIDKQMYVKKKQFKVWYH